MDSPCTWKHALNARDMTDNRLSPESAWLTWRCVLLLALPTGVLALLLWQEAEYGCIRYIFYRARIALVLMDKEQGHAKENVVRVQMGRAGRLAREYARRDLSDYFKWAIANQAERTWVLREIVNNNSIFAGLRRTELNSCLGKPTASYADFDLWTMVPRGHDDQPGLRARYDGDVCAGLEEVAVIDDRQAGKRTIYRVVETSRDYLHGRVVGRVFEWQDEEIIPIVP